MRLRKDVHGQAIRFAHRHIGGHIEDAPRKGALDGPHLAAIDPHLGDVVDPFKVNHTRLPEQDAGGVKVVRYQYEVRQSESGILSGRLFSP